MYTLASLPVSVACGGFLGGSLLVCRIYAAPPCIFSRFAASIIVLLALARRE